MCVQTEPRESSLRVFSTVTNTCKELELFKKSEIGKINVPRSSSMKPLNLILKMYIERHKITVTTH